MEPTNSTQDDFRVLSTAETAAILRKNKRTLDNWRSLGRGPAYIKLNKRDIGYLYPDVVSYIRKHRIEPQG